MKSFLLFVTATLLFVCCNNNSNEPEENNDSVTVNRSSWEVMLNDSGYLSFKKVQGSGPDTLTTDAVIQFLNNSNDNVKLQFTKISGDTLYVSIPEATYLTQQMGSSGPQEYFAKVVYNLTEIPGIHYVKFDFEEGDHAAPAVLNRNSFKE
jgi:hypothetical protein